MDSSPQQCFITALGKIFDGGSTAFVYTWVSKQWKMVYVGQTNDSRGTLGRARAHVGSAGTLRKRFEEEVGINLESAADLVLFSFPLPQRPEYTSEESSYREAIEYLVQVGLYELRLKLEPPPKIISVIRCIPARVSEVPIRRRAKQILEIFHTQYDRN